MSEIPSFWWVNQVEGSYRTGQQLGYIWASIATTKGKKVWHWDNVGCVKEGDIIFHYTQHVGIRAVSIAKTNGHRASNEEEKLIELDEPSWVVHTAYKEISPIPKDRFSNAIRDLSISNGPVNKRGNVNQVYLVGIPREAAEILTKEIESSRIPSGLREALEPAQETPHPKN